VSDLPEGLSPETEEVLRRARLGERMPAGHRRRLRGALLARIALGATTLAAGQGAVSAMGAGFVAKAVVGVAIIGSLGAGTYVALRPARHAVAPTHVVAPRAPKLVAPPPVVEVPALPPEPVAPPAPVVRAHRSAERRAPAAASDLAVETALLRDADRALRAGDTATAIARLDEHAARYPKGALAPERTAERLIVMCELGVADPRAVAQLLASGSGSPLAARVRRACAAKP
jgi:hypothetical protein